MKVSALFAIHFIDFVIAFSAFCLIVIIYIIVYFIYWKDKVVALFLHLSLSILVKDEWALGVLGLF